MVGTPNRFMVRYRDNAKLEGFFVHTIEDALWWGVYLRSRWGLSSWIDRELAPAVRPTR